MRNVRRQAFCVSLRFAQLVIAALLGLASPSHGNEATEQVRRTVTGNVLVSDNYPSVVIKVSPDYRFVCSQRINLFGNAEAEQIIFVKQAKAGGLISFYLFQFEHYLPSNKFTYDYESMRSSQIGNLRFKTDVKSWPDLGSAIKVEPNSDIAAFERALAAKGVTLAPKTALVRMFHLPTDDHRRELMILYGETIPEHSDVPVRKGGVLLDAEAPVAARRFYEHALSGFSIREP